MGRLRAADDPRELRPHPCRRGDGRRQQRPHQDRGSEGSPERQGPRQQPTPAGEHPGAEPRADRPAQPDLRFHARRAGDPPESIRARHAAADGRGQVGRRGGDLGLTKDIMRRTRPSPRPSATRWIVYSGWARRATPGGTGRASATRIESSLGTADPAYKKHMARETKILTTLASQRVRNYKKNRDDMRKVVDFEAHHGPHVPFMRHGNHAVYTEFHITPGSGRAATTRSSRPPTICTSSTTSPSWRTPRTSSTTRLGHEDVNITVNNAHEVVYDKLTGEQAAHWTVEKPDRTAKTYTAARKPRPPGEGRHRSPSA